jgi:hypothetical protein
MFSRAVLIALKACILTTVLVAARVTPIKAAPCNTPSHVTSPSPPLKPARPHPGRASIYSDVYTNTTPQRASDFDEVALARRSHPFPFRTRPLSFSAPMVLHTRESRSLPHLFFCTGLVSIYVDTSPFFCPYIRPGAHRTTVAPTPTPRIPQRTPHCMPPSRFVTAQGQTRPGPGLDSLPAGQETRSRHPPMARAWPTSCRTNLLGSQP